LSCMNPPSKLHGRLRPRRGWCLSYWPEAGARCPGFIGLGTVHTSSPKQMPVRSRRVVQPWSSR
jgi:hypothetical protein